MRGGYRCEYLVVVGPTTADEKRCRWYGSALPARQALLAQAIRGVGDEKEVENLTVSKKYIGSMTVLPCEPDSKLKQMPLSLIDNRF